MGSFGKWFWGIVILTIISLLVGWFAPAPWGAKANSIQMGSSIEAALTEAGFGSWAKSEMSGNVARLSGTAPSEAAKNAAIETAKNAQCEKCANREAANRWHVVDGSNIKVEKVIPTQVPYTLSGVHAENGGIVLNGYVRSEAEAAKLLAEAERIFPGKVTNNVLKVAKGAPDIDWYSVALANMEGLGALDYGQFDMTDMDSLLTGFTKSEDIRANVIARLGALPAGFNGASKITVPNASAISTGQIKSENVCQELFDELKGDNKISFAYARAEIRGDASLRLLNSMAKAAMQCSAFRVTVEGHTDADGSEAYNQGLSQQRADAVAAYLISHGVDAANVSAIGYGETRPIASNDTPDGMAKNRRIEFKVTRSK